MLQKIQPNPETLKSSKDRAFGEYANHVDHQCPCFQGSALGPPQYEAGDVYFCFAKFANPFARKWVARYAALTILAPRLDALHEIERALGRPLMPPEWGRADGVLMQGIQPMRTSAKGITALCERVELWLKNNMVDDIDHRIIKARTPEAWRIENAQLCRLYGSLPWAKLDRKANDWMRLHATTSTLEMLRQTDHLYMAIPVPYVEPAKEPEKDEAKNKNRSKVLTALAGEDSIETQAEPEQRELLG